MELVEVIIPIGVEHQHLTMKVKKNEQRKRTMEGKLSTVMEGLK